MNYFFFTYILNYIFYLVDKSFKILFLKCFINAKCLKSSLSVCVCVCVRVCVFYVRERKNLPSFHFLTTKMKIVIWKKIIEIIKILHVRTSSKLSKLLWTWIDNEKQFWNFLNISVLGNWVVKIKRKLSFSIKQFVDIWNFSLTCWFDDNKCYQTLLGYQFWIFLVSLLFYLLYHLLFINSWMSKEIFPKLTLVKLVQKLSFY